MSPDSRAPESASGWLAAADGTRLHVRSWRPARGAAATVVIAHGVGEHGGRYAELAVRLARRGIAVHAFDQRGHGLSGGAPAHVERWDRYLDDLDRFLVWVLAEGWGPASSPILLGHSMGSLIVLEEAGRADRPPRRPDVAGLITSGAALDPHGVARPWKVAAARILSRVLPRFPLDLGISGEDLSRDPAVVRAYRDDPLVRRRATARWGAEALAAVERVRALVPSIRLPLLAVHGGDDPIASADGSRWLVDTVGSDDTRLEILPGAQHEPHNDMCRDRVAALMADWIAARTPDWAGAPGPLE